MPIVVMVGVIAFLLLASVPVFVGILGGTLVAHSLYGPSVPDMVFAQQMVRGINKFALLAVPLFIFSSAIIARGEIGKRLLDLVEAFVGHFIGGMAIATVVTCALFGALSGVGQAAIVSLGPLVYPVLVRQGYSSSFAIGLILTASTLAMLIPPSVAMILYSLQATSSVADGFLAGLSAGLVLLFCLVIYAYVYARLNGIYGNARKGWGERVIALKNAGLSIGLPLIVFGGIYSGIFTPTEAAAGACLYASFVEVVIYKSLKIPEFWNLSKDTALIIAALLIILAAGSAMSYFLTLQRVPHMVSSLLEGTSTLELLLIVNLVFLFAGMVLDPNSAIVILTPIVLPAAIAAGIDPVHFGAIVVLNIAIGMITPPFGINIFTSMITFKVSYGEVVRGIWPFVFICLLALAIVSISQGMILWLPSVFGATS